MIKTPVVWIMYGQFWNLPSIRQTPPFVGDVPKTWGESLGVLFKPSLFDVWMEVWRFYQAFSVPNYHEICVWFRGIICSLKPLVSSFLNGNADFQAFFSSRFPGCLKQPCFGYQVLKGPSARSKTKTGRKKIMKIREFGTWKLMAIHL